MQSTATTPQAGPDLTLRATRLDLPADRALLEITVRQPLSAARQGLIDGVVAMLEEALFLDAAPGPAIDCGYRWLLRPALAAQYAAMFASYFDFLGIRCAVSLAPALRPGA